MCNLDYLHCSGCSACKNVCPSDAISMEENDEGFLYPVINKEKCTQCGLCKKVCPISKQEVFNDNPIDYFAMQSKNERILYNSSSGGVFYSIAKYILDKDGYICGAELKNKETRHIIINNEKDLYKLMGSKYVQSEIGDVYKEIKAILENNKLVLFTGTPCQVAGLKSFLNKNYDNLYTIDLICHGVPSPKVFKRYLEENNITDEKIYFRDKTNGWNRFNFVVKNNYGDLIKDEFTQNIYIKGFLQNIYLRKTCSSCQYAKLNRCSDMTLGDFWSVEYFHKNFRNNKGTSLVLLNSQKGCKVFREIKKHFYCSETSKENAIKSNKTLSSSWKASIHREDFFNEFKNSNIRLDQLIRKYLDEKAEVGILNLFYTNNYGAILTAYALRKTVEKLGYNSKVINFIPEYFKNKTEEKFQKFANENLNLTQEYNNKEQLKALNNSISTFIVGSDQVWRGGFYRDLGDIFYLGFADKTKKLLSYAASFGVDKYEGSMYDIFKNKLCLNCFSAVSVREKSGIDILKNIFNIDAIQTLDPVFLLNSSEWDSLIKNSNQDTDYIACNILDNSKDIDELLQKISLKNNLKIININNAQSVEQWLNYIKNAKYIITDSFHCSCFSILFNKKFICMENELRGKSRLLSLFEMFEIKNRFKKISDNDIEISLKEDINYDKVANILENKRTVSIDYLEKALKNDNENKYLDFCIRDEYFSKEVALENLENYESTLKLWFKYIKYLIKSVIHKGEKKQKYKNRKREIREKLKNKRTYLCKGK